MAEITSKELAKAACKALSDRRGRDIVTIYVRDKTVLCDYFVLASGSSSTQIRALGEHVEEKIAEEYNVEPTRTEGVHDGRWAVIDYGDVIVHIFNDETRRRKSRKIRGRGAGKQVRGQEPLFKELS